MMTLSEELQWRGFIQQTTLQRIEDLDKAPQTFYHGFDASADSQTIGNLAAMMFDKVFIRHGWKAVLLAGGATSLIGDPGGKDAERTLQAEEILARNVENAQIELKRIFSGYDFTMVNNIDWTKSMSVLDFLRDIGKHYSMTQLVQRDYIARRIGEGGSGISYTEFSYTLLQGMDYLHLFDNYNVTMQLGGSDQWGNCLSGVDLIRRARGAEVHTITLPLVINQATGKKFGKSEDGAVWLNPDKTSTYAFYQFWINTDDIGAEGYLKVYTELDKPTIDDVMAAHRANPSERIAQRTLAYEVTKIVHGQENAEQARKISEDLFSNSYQSWDKKDYEAVVKDLPHATVAVGDAWLDVIIEVGFAKSKGEARTLVQQSSLKIAGDRVVTNENPVLSESDFVNGHLVLVKGSKYKAILKLA